MDKAAAQKLVQTTLEASFDKERFVSLLKNMLNRFDESKARHFRGYVKEKFKTTMPIIKTYERVGTYTDSEDRKTDLLIVYLQKEHSIERARTSLRNFVADYLKHRGMKDAALVAFVAPNGADWRFSFVKMEYRFDEKGTVKDEFTPARRYSFLVGKNENSHTAQSRLLPMLLKEETDPTLDELEDAFSVEQVTKEFFEKYRDLFWRLKESLEGIVKKDATIKADFKAKNVQTDDFAKKLLGQIVFLYFLQKKGWFGVKRGKDWGSGSKHFLRELFDRKHRDYNNFFNDILEPLFYEALRLERPKDYYDQFKCRIPFLNGGLFDPINDYDWQDTDIEIPDDIFSNSHTTKEGDSGNGVLDVFDRYNFTVKEDEPLEKEVAIDPEMLGKVFENLLVVKDRKSKGAYYTPREIVHYMCQQSLINYLYNELNHGVVAYEKIGDRQTGLFGNEAPKNQLDLTIEHRSQTLISKEDIETLIQHGETSVEHDTTHREKTAKNSKYRGNYDKAKLPKSIARQARRIDEKLESIRVCDPAVGSGAFVVGMMNEIIRTRNALTPHISENGERSPYHFKRQAIQNCLYGVDIDPGAVEIAKLRLWLSLVVDEEERETIQPLPNLDYKIVQGNSLLSINKLFNHQLSKQIEKLKPCYFNETSASKKQKYKEQIDKLFSEITNSRRDFDFEVYFSEVFHEKKGFDVVIANPPYVKEYVNRSAFDGLRDSPYYQGKMDLWYMFTCKGIDSLGNNGILTFIAQNNWGTNYGASKMRNKVIKDTQILSLIDFGDFKVFAAGVQTMVMILKKNTELESYCFDCRRLQGNDLKTEDVVVLLNKESGVNIEYLFPKIERVQLIDRLLTFSTSDVQKILEKISTRSNFRLNGSEVANGIHHHHDRVNKKRGEILGDKFNTGDGIFVLSDKEKRKFPSLRKRELSILKPSYTTTELSRWHANPANQEWVIYTDSTFKEKKKIQDYPNIKKHLDRFNKVITSDNKPYGLHRSRDENFFKGEKIIAVRKCTRPTFTYVNFDSYVSATFYVIKTKKLNNKWLVGVLNSQLIAFWLRHRGKMQGTNYQIDKEPLVMLPLMKPSLEAQEAVARFVDKILAITKDDDYLQNPTKKAKVCDYEKQIDQLVYQLYGLTDKEIQIVENHGR